MNVRSIVDRWHANLLALAQQRAIQLTADDLVNAEASPENAIQNNDLHALSMPKTSGIKDPNQR